MQILNYAAEIAQVSTSIRFDIVSKWEMYFLQCENKYEMS